MMRALAPLALLASLGAAEEEAACCCGASNETQAEDCGVLELCAADDCCTRCESGGGGACEPGGWGDEDCGRCDGPADCGEADCEFDPFIAIFVVTGMGFISGGIFNHVFRSKTLNLHRTQGQTVDGRCLNRWSEIRTDSATSDNNGARSSSTYFYNTIAFCVKMPNPTPTAAFFQVTKKVEVGRTGGSCQKPPEPPQWAMEGDVVQMSHIMSVTSNPRSAIRVSDMNEEGKRARATGLYVLLGAVFAGGALTLIVGTCGLPAVYLPILIGVPVLMMVGCAKRQEKARMDPDGDVVEVDEQAATNLLTQPVAAQQQQAAASSVVATATATAAAAPAPAPAPVATTSTANPVAGAQPIEGMISYD